jgi:hypothetical protein
MNDINLSAPLFRQGSHPARLKDGRPDQLALKFFKGIDRAIELVWRYAKCIYLPRVRENLIFLFWYHLEERLETETLLQANASEGLEFPRLETIGNGED